VTDHPRLDVAAAYESVARSGWIIVCISIRRIVRVRFVASTRLIVVGCLATIFCHGCDLGYSAHRDRMLAAHQWGKKEIAMKSLSILIQAALAAVLLSGASVAWSDSAEFSDIEAQVARQHDEGVKRLQEWIRLPSIAAEGIGYPEGPRHMISLLQSVGFQHAEMVETDGKPGVFATLDAGAPQTVGIYLMYDVKHFDPAEWSSPPLEAALVDKAGLGKVMMGRGAVNQKGPQMALLEAIRAIHATGKKLPVNLVVVAEGEEEIGSPNIGQIVYRGDVQAALSKTIGVFMPAATQSPDGVVMVTLGAKGVIEVQLTASGENWGRGPGRDVHSSLKAMIDSPVWRLVHALNTLVSEDGNTITIDDYPTPREIDASELAMIEEAARRQSEAQMKERLSTSHWIDDLPFEKALQRLVSQPTVNIEGLVAGYTGPGGKTVLPHKAEAKLDLRLVPGMTAAGALAALKAHLERRGFGDIELNFSGGYDPTSTPADAEIIRAQISVLKAAGIDPILWPRSPGSYPGYVFTGPPLNLGSGHFGLGHGSGAHAPDEYFVIESSTPNVEGWDGAVLSYVRYLYELGK
jgi:acetylornithine deacetylase/succinyl-diaminopimelate desuccinylase-like protein